MHLNDFGELRIVDSDKIMQEFKEINFKIYRNEQRYEDNYPSETHPLRGLISEYRGSVKKLLRQSPILINSYAYFNLNIQNIFSEVHIIQESERKIEIVKDPNNEEKYIIIASKRKFFEMNDNETLDYIAIELPLIKNATKAIKEKIVRGDILKGDDFLNNLENLNEIIGENEIDSLEREIVSINTDITNYENHLTNLINKKRERINKINFIKDNRKEDDRFLKLKRYREIRNVKLINNELVILTNPIILSIPEEKIKRINKRQVREHLESGGMLGIGEHKIRINLNSFSIHYHNLHNFINHHIENYTCYGTFGSAIHKAQENGDLFQLVVLSLQMLKQATIGDPAGNSTINSAYFLSDQSGLFVKDKEKLIPVQEFLKGVRR